MKTRPSTTPAARILAGLAVLMIAGLTQAAETEAEVGTVRISDTSETDASSAIVVRGQSDLRRRNARTARALRELLFDTNVRPAAMTSPARAAACDCCPRVGDACCPAPACEAPNVCCPPACAAPPAGCDVPDCCPTTCDGCDTVGRYRITDICLQCGGKGCRACGGRRTKRHGRSGQNVCSHCNASPCQCGHGHGGWLSGQLANHHARNYTASARMNAYLRCKLGYFIHDGSGGTGSPLFGHYKVVYPVNPGHFDERDGQVYAAQGYGGPVSVPLAPVVRDAYNYGWGIPSSRLTPVSNRPTP